jgi:lysophospholipase L1-like esterase
MAAGPGITPKAHDAPFGSGRSAANYAHLVAQRLSYDLVDVTFSGATTAHVLTDRQRTAPTQVEALDGSEELVTITIGGNDAGYVPMLYAAGLPRLLRSLPVLGPRLRDQLDPAARDVRLAQVADSLIAVGRATRRRHAEATHRSRRLRDGLRTGSRRRCQRRPSRLVQRAVDEPTRFASARTPGTAAPQRGRQARRRRPRRGRTDLRESAQ